MILACPACRTRYQVDARALARPAGRTVRCAECGHSWLYRRPAPVPPEPREVPGTVDAPPLAVSPRAAITAPPPPRPHQGGAAGGIALILVLLLAALAGLMYFGRERVVALWPPAARLYAVVGLPGDALGGGLDIVNVTSTRNPDGIIVEGDVTNRLDLPRPIPELRVALRDAAQKEVAVKVVDPPKPRLLPGETAHFVAAFMPVSDAAVGVVVTFTAG